MVYYDVLLLLLMIRVIHSVIIKTTGIVETLNTGRTVALGKVFCLLMPRTEKQMEDVQLLGFSPKAGK